MGTPVSLLTANRAIVRDAAFAAQFDGWSSAYLTATIAVQMAQLLTRHQFAINVCPNILAVSVNLQEVAWTRVSCCHLTQPLSANVGHWTKALSSLASSVFLSLGYFEVPASHHVHGDNQASVVFEKQLLIGIKPNCLGFA
jgi:hypothetical protein